MGWSGKGRSGKIRSGKIRLDNRRSDKRRSADWRISAKYCFAYRSVLQIDFENISLIFLTYRSILQIDFVAQNDKREIVRVSGWRLDQKFVSPENKTKKVFFNTHLDYSFNVTLVYHWHVMGGKPPPSGDIFIKNLNKSVNRTVQSLEFKDKTKHNDY